MQEEKKAKGKSEAKLTGTNADLRALKVTEANDMLRCAADIALKLPGWGPVRLGSNMQSCGAHWHQAACLAETASPEVCSSQAPSCLLHPREACGTVSTRGSCCRPVLLFGNAAE